MTRTRLTFLVWATLFVIHLGGLSLLFPVVLVLEPSGGAVLEFAAGLLLILIVGTPVVGLLWCEKYLESDEVPLVGGFCRTCGYDLNGNVSGVCPECGTKVKSP